MRQKSVFQVSRTATHTSAPNGVRHLTRSTEDEVRRLLARHSRRFDGFDKLPFDELRVYDTTGRLKDLSGVEGQPKVEGEPPGEPWDCNSELRCIGWVLRWTL
jgi:hypothetical protein